MTSSRPYLLRAFYEWILDNNFTPYIVLNADHPDVCVPTEFVENGRIVLNISPNSIKGLLMANDHVEFSARFKGVPYNIYAPCRAVEAIYAKENGRGMVFKDDEENEDETPPPSGGGPKAVKSSDSKSKDTKSKGGKRPTLTVVK